eukprot:3344379-Rhodomonas_salina.1
MSDRIAPAVSEGCSGRSARSNARLRQPATRGVFAGMRGGASAHQGSQESSAICARRTCSAPRVTCFVMR